MKRTSLFLFASAFALSVAACQQTAPDPVATKAEAGTALGIDTAAMDKSVKPGDDFYAFANGAWMKATEIPADRSSIGGFTMADLKREAQVKEMLAGLIEGKPAAGSDEARIADFYRAFLDTAAIDRAGIAPVQGDLAAIAAIADKRGLAQAIGASLRADVDPLNATNYSTENLFGVFITQGLTTPGEQIPYLLQGGLGMPEREYYISGEAEMAKQRTAYRTFIEAVMRTAGSPNPAAAATRILALETKIASAHADRATSEDFTKGAQIWSRADLEKRAPGLDWGALLGAAQLGSAAKFQAYHSTSIPRLAALVGSEPLDAWKDWLAFHMLSQKADVLPAPIRDASFAFNGTSLNGTPQQRSRERLAIDATSVALPDAVGKAYVAKYFPASAKAEVQAMNEKIKEAFAKRVEALDWMAPATKAEALKKVRSIVVGVGYPEVWRDYGNVTIGATDPYGNAKAAGLAEYRHQLAKIGKPMDRNEWWMPPQLVNAVNLPVQNALNFPAAILQRPFFDPTADAAFNYGAIGAVIGHEISHSFDNNGSAFDSTGLMRNWWTDADKSRFNQAGSALAAQFDQYEPFPGLKVNGKLTLGENIADVAGLAAAYDAYRASLGGKQAPVIGGYSGDQRFFIAYAQAWASKMRDAAMRGRIATDGHAPGQYRALTVRNNDAWYAAFNVQPTDKLYLPPEKRVKVW